MDVRGQKVATLVHQRTDAGAHSIQWNGLDDAGKQAAGGVYMVVLKSKEYRNIKKLVFLK
jgi:flagellar hook assembly protein FlgD